jgi:hypothetical protein
MEEHRSLLGCVHGDLETVGNFFKRQDIGHRRGIVEHVERKELESTLLVIILRPSICVYPHFFSGFACVDVAEKFFILDRAHGGA